jgi:uncharacterized membrane protein YeiH
VPESVTTALRLLDLVGIVAFALSGGLAAVAARMDAFGILVLAIITAVGGGITRDVMIDVPPTALRDPWYLVLPLMASAVCFAFHPEVARLGTTIVVLDALGLGMFAVNGSAKALVMGLGPMPAVLLGVVTAVGGGVMRDVLLGEVPAVLRRDLYAVPALIGAGVPVAAHLAGLRPEAPAVLLLGVAVTTVLRLFAVALGLDVPRSPRPVLTAAEDPSARLAAWGARRTAGRGRRSSRRHGGSTVTGPPEST